MRVFITGATGFIGSALVQELSRTGHEITGLNRSKENDGRVGRLGAEPLRGSLNDPAGWEKDASEHEVMIHTAFDYRADGVALDAAAIESLLRAAALAEEPRLVIYTSGCWVLGDTRDTPADERASTEHPAGVVEWRPGHERRVLEGATGSVITAVIRPGMVYGGHGGLTRRLFESAEEDGAAVLVGSGENHWSLVHRRDLARLYRMVAELRGSGVFHGVDGHPVKAAAAARAASDAAGAGGAVRSIPLESARDSLGPVADALCLDQRLIAARSADLGWRPRHASFPDCADQAYRELKAWRH